MVMMEVNGEAGGALDRLMGVRKRGEGGSFHTHGRGVESEHPLHTWRGKKENPVNYLKTKRKVLILIITGRHKRTNLLLLHD